MNLFMAPSSYGEALDRLTILELKKKFIQDARKKDVEREYDDLKELVRSMLEKDPYHYSKLLEVNLIMWLLQDELHSGTLTDKEKEYNMMKQLAVENQRRFRLKRTLNEFLGSRHKEQKGYKGHKCLVLGHQGMGDHLFINGAIRYLATYYDEVCIVVKENYLENLKTLYASESAVTFHVIKDDSDFSPNFGASQEKFSAVASNYDMGYMLGYHGASKVNDFPLCFYDDMKMERRIMLDWSYLPSTRSAEDLPPFIFYHNRASNFTANIPVDLETQLVLNPSENMYPVGHKWHELAQAWVGLPFFDYIETLKKAEKILVTDSSFFCAALLLKRMPEVWSRGGRTYRNVVADLIEHGTA
jgi:hypothetical protein